MRTLLGPGLFGIVMVLAMGCGSDAADSSSSDDGKLVAPAESCTATFVWLQKDAYKETGGRTTTAWPPHTTTTLSVDCGDGTIDSAFMANHGSEPGSKDAKGRDFLDEMRRVTVTGTRAELGTLLTTYQGCECPPDSFLSMDSLDQSLVSDLLSHFTDLVQGDSVSCPDASKEDLVTALKNQDFAAALGIVPTCTWPGPDGTPAESLTEALQTVLATSQQTLADYHVCNNDAKLQADLVLGFTSGQPVVACDRTAITCQGPMWFYDPTAQAQ